MIFSKRTDEMPDWPDFVFYRIIQSDRIVPRARKYLLKGLKKEDLISFCDSLDRPNQLSRELKAMGYPTVSWIPLALAGEIANSLSKRGPAWKHVRGALLCVDISVLESEEKDSLYSLVQDIFLHVVTHPSNEGTFRYAIDGISEAVVMHRDLALPILQGLSRIRDVNSIDLVNGELTEEFVNVLVKLLEIETSHQGTLDAGLVHSLRRVVQKLKSVEQCTSAPVLYGLLGISHIPDLSPELSRLYTQVGPPMHGYFSYVYKVTSNETGQVYALKRIRKPEANFLSEYENWKDLHFKYIVELLDARTNPEPYFVMEYVEGETLRDKLGRNPHGLPILSAVSVFMGMCLAVTYAHRRGVHHLDLKPSNIMISGNGVPKITDWGNSRGESNPDFLDSIGSISNVVRAPEQLGVFIAGSNEVDEVKIDIYQLGLVAYWMMTGKHPFLRSDELSDAVSVDELQSKMSSDSIDYRLVDHNGIRDIVSRCLAADPNMRFDSALELTNSVDRVIREDFSVSHDLSDYPVLLSCQKDTEELFNQSSKMTEETGVTTEKITPEGTDIKPKGVDRTALRRRILSICALIDDLKKMGKTSFQPLKVQVDGLLRQLSREQERNEKLIEQLKQSRKTIDAYARIPTLAYDRLEIPVPLLEILGKIKVSYFPDDDEWTEGCV